MIDACGLYDILKDYASLDEKVFCDLHKCGDQMSCDKHQSKKMINFDDVKTKFCNDNKLETYSSVDAVAYNDYGVFFLIEAKSWEVYYKWQYPKSEEDVKKQVDDYDFTKKLEESLKVCKCIASKSVSEISIPIVYVVVTDASVKRDMAEPLLAMLDFLSQTSSDLSVVYSNEIKRKLSNTVNSENYNIDIDNHYVDNCQQLDDVIDSWKSARMVTFLTPQSYQY